jgi:putative transposase
MVWRQSDVHDERLRFIAAFEEGGWTMTELCRAFGVSRKTGYKLLGRYRELGLERLKDLTRAPHGHPNRTSEEIERLLVAARRGHPHWGARKLLAWLERRHEKLRWPAPSTIGEILQRHRLVKPRRRVRRATPSRTPLVSASEPNALWCCDFKRWFRTLDGRRCDPLTVTDAFSRYALVCRGLLQPIYRYVRP